MPGENGKNGKSGGNVYVRANEIRNASKWTIISKGGNGSNGKDGGDGKDGENGKDGVGLTEADFKRTFSLVAHGYGNSACSSRRNAIKARISDKRINFNKSGCTYTFDGHIEGKTTINGNDHDITFCTYQFFGRTSYLLLKGTPELEGTSGGDGGQGGKAGIGGYAGKITIEILKVRDGQQPKTMEVPGSHGEPGKDGKGGVGGRNGEKGPDNLRIETRTSADYYRGALNVRYEPSSSSEASWCPYYERYAKNKTGTYRSTQSKQTDGTMGKIKQNEEQKEVYRQTSIMMTEMAMFHEEIMNENALQLDIVCPNEQDKEISLDVLQKTKQSTLIAFDDGNESSLKPNKNIVISMKPKMKRVKLIQKSQETESQSVLPQGNYQINKLIRQNENEMSDESDYMDIFAHIVESQKLDDKFYVDYISVVRHKTRFFNDSNSIKLCYDECSNIQADDIRLVNLLESTLGELRDKYKLTRYKFLKEQMDLLIFQTMHSWSDNDMKVINSRLRTAYKTALLSLLMTKATFLEAYDNKTKENLIGFKFFLDGSRETYDVLTSENLMTPICGVNDMEELEEALYANEEDNFILEDDQNNNPPAFKEEIASINNKIETFFTELENKSQIKSQIKSLLEQLQYLNWQKDKIVELLELILIHLKNELQGNEEKVSWIISFIIEFSQCDGLDDLLLAAYTPTFKDWALECLVLLVRKTNKLSVRDELDLRSEFKKFYNTNTFIRISQRLMGQDKSERFPIMDIINILKCCECLQIDDDLANELSACTLSYWPERLRWHVTMQQLSGLKVIWDEKGESFKMNALYLLTELQNTYGDDTIKKLVRSLEEFSSIKCKDLNHMLQNFVSGYWRLDASVLASKIDKDFKEWLSTLEKDFESSTEKDLETLIHLVVDDQNTSLSKNTVQQARCIIEEWNILLKSDPLYRELQKSDFKKFKPNKLMEIDIKRLAAIDQAVYLTNGFYLRDTQRLAVVLFLITGELNKGMLQQLSTGEGKSIIIVVLSIYQVLNQNKVDIITSSPVLAIRDSEECKETYELFNISVGHNGSEYIAERKEVYVNKEVVYGEIGAFQRDLLLDEFYNEDIGIGGREKGFIIVDEVDSMLLDKGENILYLSHNIQGMDKLESLYVFIWQLVHVKGLLGTEDDIQSLIELVHNSIKERVQKENLINIVSELEIDNIWKHLIKMKIINEKGGILDTYSFKNNDFTNHPIMEINDTDKPTRVKLLNLMKDIVLQGTELVLPKFLERFIDIHLHDWISNAFMAKSMVQNDQYIIDIDRSNGASSCSNNIIIINKDTGVEQFNSQWNHGLHQFLQLKHGCRISFESLQAVFISNVSLFKKYDSNIFGLTGSLGTDIERCLLKTIFNVEYATIPSFKQSRFRELLAKAVTDEQEWLREISQSAIEKKQEERPVLIICDTVKKVEQISKHFKSLNQDVEVYKHSYEKFQSSNSTIDVGKIIVATNLAGQGTDLKISDNINKKGGLHVIFSYMPKNHRIEEQAFGRAARKGQNGSGQIVCCVEDSDKVTSLMRALQLKVDRQDQESSRINSIKKQYYNVTKYEEQYFDEFSKAYRALTIYLKGFEGEEEQKIILQSCLDNWAFWLDEVSYKHKNETVPIKNANVLDFISSMRTDNSSFYHLVKNPANRIKLALILRKKNREMAECLLDEVILEDDRFSEIASYYKCYFDIRKNGLDSSNMCQTSKQFKKIQRQIENTCQEVTANSSTISLIAKSYNKKRRTFLPLSDYKEQKQGVVQIYQTFISAINNILGEEATLMKLSLENGRLELPEAWIIFQYFVNEGIFSKMHVKRRIKEEKEALEEKYALYYYKIEEKLNQKYQKAITFDDLKYLTPSKKELWELMENVKLIKSVTTYAVVEKEILKQNGGWLDISDERIQNESEKFIQEFSLGKENLKIYMHSEYKDAVKNDSVKVIPIDFFRCVDEDYETFLKDSGIKITKTAEMETDKTDKTIIISKYDKICSETFTEIRGINLESSEEIYQQLVENEVIHRTHGTPLIDKITKEGAKLSIYLEYEAEILSVLNKNFQYYFAMKAYKNQEPVFLENYSSSLLMEDLISFDIIEPVKVHEETNYEKVIDKIYEYKIKVGSVKKESVQSLKSTLEKWKANVYKFGEIDAGLRDIREMFPSASNHKIQNDLEVFINNGFSHIIVLHERKWTLVAILKIGVIILIGLAQIVLGVVLEVVSARAMTFVASGLIGEGIGDIMFAIQCAATGYCTWTAYAQHKVISIAVTVITCGIGAFMARGAKFSKFGYKLAAKHLQTVTGKELLKEVTKKALTKAVVVRIAEKGVEAVALGISNAIVDNLGKKAVDSMTEDILNNCIVNIENRKLANALEELAKKVGVEEAGEIVSKINAEILNDQRWLQTVEKYGKMAASGICKGINEASKKVGASGGKLSMIASMVSTVTSQAMNHTAAMKSDYDIVTMVDSHLSKCYDKIQQKFNTLDSTKKGETSSARIEDFKLEICEKWKDDLALIIREKLLSEIVEPAIQSLGHHVVHSAGKFIQNKYSEHREEDLIKAFNKLKQQKQKQKEETSQNNKNQPTCSRQYNMDEMNQMMKIMKKTIDPKLYAEIIKEGAPGSVHCAQAFSDILGQKVVIKMSDGSKPLELNPEGGVKNNKNINLCLDVNGENTIGHFKVAGDNQNEEQITNYDCFFEAFNEASGRNISREEIADHIVKNKRIKKDIEMGIHDCFIRRGKVGGAERNINKEDNLRIIVDILREHEDFDTAFNIMNSKGNISNKLRDSQRNMNSRIKVKGSGNDEIFQVKKDAIKIYHERIHERRDRSTIDSKDYDEFDCMLHLRVDTQYQIYDAKDIEGYNGSARLQGHPGALFKTRNPKGTKGGQFKGSSRLHQNRMAEIVKGETAKDSAVKGMESDLKQNIPVNKLINETFMVSEPLYTTTRHNLQNIEERKEWSIGYRRELIKKALVTESIKGTRLDEELRDNIFYEGYKNDPYVKCVMKKIDRAEKYPELSRQRMESYGVILRKPAPIIYDKQQQDDPAADTNHFASLSYKN